MELDPKTTAVIAVHLQNDIAGEGAFADFFHEQVVTRDVLSRCRTALDGARDAGATVIFTRVAFQPDYSDLNPNSPLLAMVKQFNALINGTDKSAIVDEVAPQSSDIIVTHQRVGCFVDSDLDRQLRSRGITAVAVCGVTTNASVEATVRTASDLGYRMILVEDGCSAATAQAHQASVDSMGLLAEISTVAEVVAALRASAASLRHDIDDLGSAAGYCFQYPKNASGCLYHTYPGCRLRRSSCGFAARYRRPSGGLRPKCSSVRRSLPRHCLRLPRTRVEHPRRP